LNVEFEIFNLNFNIGLLNVLVT